MKRRFNFENCIGASDDSTSSMDDSAGTTHDGAGMSFNSTRHNESNTEDLAGRIESLHMVNFMCHSNFELNFNKRVNFITGRNGSGKSAIMAALVVVLGGSASHTHRGTGITDFIKKGENSARVTLTLNNDGLNSFKKETYGSRIVITRNISSSGSHGYLCKSAEGRVISKKKEEVDNIVQALNLQIKNPICVLNQDVARSFLCSTDNSHRFSMFEKATQLEQLKTIYVKTLELLMESKKQLTLKEKAIESANVEINELKKKLELFASLDKCFRDRTKLENEYFWALVADENKKLDEILENKAQLMEKKEECLKWQSNFLHAVAELKNEIKACQSQLEDERKEKEAKTKLKTQTQKEVQSYDHEIAKIEDNVKSLMDKIDRQLIEINEVKQHLEKNDYIQNQEDRESTKKKIKESRERLSDLTEEIANSQRKLKEAEDARDTLLGKVEMLKCRIKEKEENKKILEGMITKKKERDLNNCTKYGHFTLNLLNAIEEACQRNEFLRRPVGPCGMHVKLTGDPKWARAVESVIGGLMTAYRCDNQKDFQVLSKIMDKICGEKRPIIIIGKFLRYRHNVESRKVSYRGFQSVLDVLHFDNDVVFNTFIDQGRIETILLFETDEQVASILTNIQNVPKNLRMGLTLQSDQYFPAPNYRTYHGNPGRVLRYFDVSSKTKDYIKKLESDLKETMRVINETTSEVQKTMEAFREAPTLVERYKNKLKDLRNESGKLQIKLNQLLDLEEARPVAVTKAALEEELENLERKHEVTSNEAKKSRQALKKLKETRDESTISLNSIVLEENKVEKNIRILQEQLEKKESKLRKIMEEQKDAGELPEINRKLREVEEEIKKARVILQEKIKAAEEICPEKIDCKRSSVEVQELLEKCEKYLKAGEKTAGSRKTTISEYKTKIPTFKEMKKMAELLKKAIELLTKTAFEKEQRLEILQSHTASLVSLYFQAILQTRGYDGLLKVNFENQLLDLEVKPRDTSIARKDSKTLSGGERSYSTISFILAVWKVVQMPFYFLDEFDVFMDNLNRKVIIDLLLEHANAHSNKQFVFITPQDTSNIQPSEVVSVYKLADPERIIL